MTQPFRKEHWSAKNAKDAKKSESSIFVSFAAPDLHTAGTSRSMFDMESFLPSFASFADKKLCAGELTSRASGAPSHA